MECNVINRKETGRKQEETADFIYKKKQHTTANCHALNVVRRQLTSIHAACYCLLWSAFLWNVLPDMKTTRHSPVMETVPGNSDYSVA